jgi:hypothetical protein
MENGRKVIGEYKGYFIGITPNNLFVVVEDKNGNDVMKMNNTNDVEMLIFIAKTYINAI